MSKNRTWITGLILVSIAGLLFGVSLPKQPALAQDGPNLLQNGNFEAGGGEAWPFQDGIPEVQIAPGWRAFYLDSPPDYMITAEYCGDDRGCSWARPEFRGISTAEAPERIHSGFLAQKYFTFGRQHEAGLFQQVGGITPGTQLRFEAYIHTWSCLQGDVPNQCPTTPLSNQPAPMHIRVGIDPTGGTNPWSGNVVWSAEGNAWDVWTLFQVEATAEAETVTVFTYSRPDWTDRWARTHNDVYIDDASLVTTTPPPDTPLPPPPTNTPGPSPTPRATATPRPDGAIVHLVQPGDTLFGVALQYNVTPEQIEQLNAGSLGPNRMLYVGQELVISIPSDVPPTPVPQTTTVSGSLTVAAIAPTPATQEDAICVLAFHDRNGDTFYQAETEELVPNAVFSLSDMNGLLGQYTSDGLSEPYCFLGLNPGTYRVLMQPPPGYAASGMAEYALSHGAAARTDVMFGAIRSEAVGTETPPGSEVIIPGSGGQDPTDEGEGSTVWAWVLRIGAGVLILGVIVAALYFFSQRRSQPPTLR